MKMEKHQVCVLTNHRVSPLKLNIRIRSQGLSVGRHDFIHSHLLASLALPLAYPI